MRNFENDSNEMFLQSLYNSKFAAICYTSFSKNYKIHNSTYYIAHNWVISSVFTDNYNKNFSSPQQTGYLHACNALQMHLNFCEYHRRTVGSNVFVRPLASYTENSVDVKFFFFFHKHILRLCTLILLRKPRPFMDSSGT